MKPTTVLRRKPSNYLDLFYNDFFEGQSPVGPYTRGVSKPAVNIMESNEDYVIDILAAGFDKEDIQIDVNGKTLTVSGTKENTNEPSETSNYRLREFRTEEFKRTFTLGQSIDCNKIEATFKNGILKITLEKKAAEKLQPARQISIN